MSRISIIGGGPRAESLLRRLHHLDPDGIRLRVTGICDPSPDSPSLALAREYGVAHVGLSAQTALPKGEVDIVVDLRDVSRPGMGIEDLLPRNATLLDENGTRLLWAVLETMASEEKVHDIEHTELLDLRERLHAFMDHSPFFIYMKGSDLRYRAVNRSGLKSLDLKEEDVVGKTDAEIFPPAVARRLKEREQEVLRTHEPVLFDGVLPLGRGRRMYFSATLFPVMRNEKSIGLFGLVEDTTDRLTSEKELVQQRVKLDETREYLQGILENSQDIIFLTRTNGTLISFNQGAEAVLGYGREEILNRPIRMLFDDPENGERLLRQALEEGHAMAYEVGMRHKTGHKLITNISMTTINTPDGQPTEVVGICRNITERLRLQEDLIQTERLAAIGKMAAGVAHEINNPLTTIENIAGLVTETINEAESVDPETRILLTEWIEKLHIQTRRCTTITHSLLGFARRPGGAPSQVSVTDLLEEALALLRPEAKRINLNVARNYAPNLPTLLTEPTQVEQIFVNLLKNAMEAIEELNPPQARIELNVSLTENPDSDECMWLAVTIADNGIGIPEENLSQVFDLFYTSKPAGKGTGLGLSIVHNILEKIGGDIRMESEYRKGSRFTLLLPTCPPGKP